MGPGHAIRSESKYPSVVNFEKNWLSMSIEAVFAGQAVLLATRKPSLTRERL